MNGRLLAPLLLLLCIAVSVGAVDTARPTKIADNIYDVGGPGDLACYLITTPQGHIVIDGGTEPDAADIRRNIDRLGFRVSDVRVLLSTQAHFDHASGLAELKRASGAQLMVSDRDAALVEGGGRDDYLFGDRFLFPSVRVDRRLKDGETVSIGGLTLTAHLTPGHTPGCTTWTFDTTNHSKIDHVVVVGGPTINPGTRLKGMATYPTIASDYARTFDVLSSLPCDIFLGAHRSYYDGAAKAARLRAASQSNPFVDPGGYRAAVARWRAAFEKQLRSERGVPH